MNNISKLNTLVHICKHLCRSSNKVDIMYSKLCIEKSFDIICISETWLDDSVSDDEITLDGYSLYRKDHNRHGGGVAVFVCDRIGVKNRIDIETFDTETLILEIMLNYKIFFVICCYRPPGFSSQRIEDYLGKFQNILDSVFRNNREFIFILGDFNDRCTNWNDDHPGSEFKSSFKNMISNNNLFQIINEPTHITPTSANLLDLIITDSPSIIIESGLDEPIGDPYHSMVFCKVYLQRVQEKSYTRTVWHYNHGDYDAFRKRA